MLGVKASEAAGDASAAPLHVPWEQRQDQLGELWWQDGHGQLGRG